MKTVLITLLFLLIGVIVFAQEDEYNDAISLSGIKGLKIELVVNNLTDSGIEIDIPDLHPEKIQNEIELNLRKAGIKVPLEDEFESNRIDYAVVMVYFYFAEKINYSYVYAISISVEQACFRYRDVYRKGRKMIVNTEAEPYWGTTWQLGYVGVNSKTSIILDAVMKGIDELINDYLSVNQ